MHSPGGYSVVAAGKTVTSAATTANTTLPAAADGTNPKMVLLTATGNLHVRLGIDNTVAATANDLMVPSGASLPLLTRGFSYIAYIQETAAAKLTIAPCEL